SGPEVVGRSAGSIPSLIRVPAPRRVTMTPASSSSRYARATVFTASSWSVASALIAGSRSPASRPPCATASRIPRRICSYGGVASASPAFSRRWSYSPMCTPPYQLRSRRVGLSPWASVAQCAGQSLTHAAAGLVETADLDGLPVGLVLLRHGVERRDRGGVPHVGAVHVDHDP